MSTKRAKTAKGSTGKGGRRSTGNTGGAATPKRRRGGRFTPTKGGDGGTAPKVKKGPNWHANALEVLTGATIRNKADRAAFEASLILTTDRHDRAHRVKVLVHPQAAPQLPESWRIAALGEIDLPGRPPRSRPRRYHPSQVVGPVRFDAHGAVVLDRRVGLDSSFDHGAAMAARIERAGICLGWGTSFPRERSTPLASRRVQEMAGHFAGMTRDQVRNRVQQRTSTDMSPEELRAQEAGTALLRGQGLEVDAEGSVVEWDDAEG